ncbi:MAG: S4 domain-containing protein [Thermoanaerobaculia bacterium]
MNERHRIDSWLKLCCVFKQRSDAAEACRGGHVKLNGNRVKPSTVVRIDDLIELTEPRFRRLVVLGLPESSISKEVARTMYRDETPELPARPSELGGEFRDRGAGRPTKKERRDISKIKGGR